LGQSDVCVQVVAVAGDVFSFDAGLLAPKVGEEFHGVDE
jgi:hypothetical protein